MLQVNEIRNEREKIEEGLKKRNIQDLNFLDEIISWDDVRKSTQYELDNILAKSNQLSREIGELYKNGKTEDVNVLRAESAELKNQTKTLQEKLNETKTKIEQLLFEVPNPVHRSVPAGKGESENIIIKSVGEPTENDLLPHWELAKKYDLIDFELGTKITGAGFPVYKGKGAKLQRALIQYFLDKNTAAGYTEVQVPILVNEASARGTGQLPDKEAQMYEVQLDGFYLIPTAEVPVTNIYRDEILEEKDLPVLLTGYTPCFRREAGSYGKDVRGLNRLHQFDKVEIVRIEKPENSYEALENMKNHVEEILNELGFTYRILHLCGGDTGFASASTFDFEVWSSAQAKWLEVSSVSNFEAFQANRLKLRYKTEKGTELCHTLNGSSLALPRILASLLEHYQTEDGIAIPAVLHAYCGFQSIEN
ncbi:serine--tRNA ligase [Candidatus Ornithobacterium hominis]|uniref:serine--tRNA ligase n=1 Tax=Candidatus Ornithobacterium hominis TaxID=2497989 RepID=UPI0024BC4390|nr:serine--tRNA ligase [Candidatus Ornithobacterium hominis]CAI9429544.1 serine--tRNA ligase [Candidatus Ornithobacterium hominis]